MYTFDTHQFKTILSKKSLSINVPSSVLPSTKKSQAIMKLYGFFNPKAFNYYEHTIGVFHEMFPGGEGLEPMPARKYKF